MGSIYGGSGGLNIIIDEETKLTYSNDSTEGYKYESIDGSLCGIQLEQEDVISLGYPDRVVDGLKPRLDKRVEPNYSVDF